jgi:hypothetical protein
MLETCIWNGIDLGRRHMLDDGFEQWRHVALAHVRREPGVAVQRRGVHHREVELLVGGAELVEQVEGLVQHPVGARAGAVDLVDDDDGLQALREGLARDEARLRHRPVHRVHQQQHRVHHGQHALNLAAEVGMTRGIHDVDAVIVPADRGVLGEDGDAALALEIVRVHDARAHLLVRGEGAGLLQELVHQRGLAVVDVGDDGDVA